MYARARAYIHTHTHTHTHENGVLNLVLIFAFQRKKVSGTVRSCIMKVQIVFYLCTPCKSMRNGAIDPFILNFDH